MTFVKCQNLILLQGTSEILEMNKFKRNHTRNMYELNFTSSDSLPYFCHYLKRAHN